MTKSTIKISSKSTEKLNQELKLIWFNFTKSTKGVKRV